MTTFAPHGPSRGLLPRSGDSQHPGNAQRRRKISRRALVPLARGGDHVRARAGALEAPSQRLRSQSTRGQVRDASAEHLEGRAGAVRCTGPRTRRGPVPDAMRICSAFGPTSNVQPRRPVLTTLRPNLGCCLPLKTVPVGIRPRTTVPSSQRSPLRARHRRRQAGDGRDGHGGGRERAPRAPRRGRRGAHGGGGVAHLGGGLLVARVRAGPRDEADGGDAGGQDVHAAAPVRVRLALVDPRAPGPDGQYARCLRPYAQYAFSIMARCRDPPCQDRFRHAPADICRTHSDLVCHECPRSPLAPPRRLAVGRTGQRDHAPADPGGPGPARLRGVAERAGRRPPRWPRSPLARPYAPGAASGTPGAP